MTLYATGARNQDDTMRRGAILAVALLAWSLGGWIGGCILFVFAWSGRNAVGAEVRR